MSLPLEKSVSLLIRNGYVVTMNADREVHDLGYVIVGDNGRIVEVGPSTRTPHQHFDKVLDARGMLVMPGLINLHQHHWYNLFKGLGGGMLLEEWIGKLLL